MFGNSTPLKSLYKEYEQILKKFPNVKLSKIGNDLYLTDNLCEEDINTIVVIHGKDIIGEQTAFLYPAHKNSEIDITILDSQNLKMPAYPNINVILMKLKEKNPELFNQLVKFIAGIDN